MNRREIELSQKVDDTTLILDGTKKSLRASFKTLDDFYEVSGLNLNNKKYKNPWVNSGNDSGNDWIWIPRRNFEWPKYKVK